MTDTDSCPTCIDKYTKSIRTKISCSYCSYHSCKPCVSRYLLSQVVDAHCMNCRTGWNREFIDANLTKTFRTGPWRDHRKQILMNREKALLPNFQIYAAAKIKMNYIQPRMTEAQKTFTEVETKKNIINTRIYSYASNIIKATSEEAEKLVKDHANDTQELSSIMNDHLDKSVKYRKLMISYNKYNNIYHDIGDLSKKEKKEFIMKCVQEGCRGFLSQSYKCELCSTYVCKDCMIVKKDKNDETHVCKKEDVDTVSMIRKDTRPCPKCGIRISKIDGCDQMWCTADGCGTAFSWTTNKIISGTIHNPHYYEWLRRNNGGVAPRPAGEILCGGVIGYTLLYNALRITFPPRPQNEREQPIVKKINEIHACLTDIEHVRIPQYNIQRDVNMFKDTHVEFLINEIDETKWIQTIYFKENNIEKKQHICLVIQTFYNAGSDLMRTLFTAITELSKKRAVQPKYVYTEEDLKIVNVSIEEFEKLRNYINASLKDLGRSMMCAIPQFGDDWRYIIPHRI